MSDLRTEINQLSDLRLDYVMARSRVTSDAQGIRESGVNKTTFYSWSEEERNKLNDIAQRLKRDTALKALTIIQNAAEEAAKVKVAGLKSRDERVKQGVATEILDRGVGKVTDKVDVTSGGEKIQPVTIIEVIKSNDESV
jgi:hypothetical protein